MTYYENTGTATAPAFVYRRGSANPFDNVGVGHFTNPELADLDADGDFDLVLGEEDGSLNYFKNTGSTTAPAFADAFKENPFVGVYVGIFTGAELADLDGDGDLDALLGAGKRPAWSSTARQRCFSTTASKAAAPAPGLRLAITRLRLRTSGKL